MSLPSGLLPPLWFGIANVLCALLLAWILLGRPWKPLKKGVLPHVFMGSCVALMLLWTIEAGISPGLNFHHLGATALTLMFGWQLAIIGSSVIVLGVTLNGMGGWEAFGLHVLLLGVLPVMVSHGIYRLVDTRLPNHFMVYIFLCAFLGAGLAMAVSAFMAVGVFTLSGTYSLERIAYEYLPFFPLIILPEALLNGMTMTLLVGLRPDWVSTFDDERYLNHK